MASIGVDAMRMMMTNDSIDIGDASDHINSNSASTTNSSRKGARRSTCIGIPITQATCTPLPPTTTTTKRTWMMRMRNGVPLSRWMMKKMCISIDTEDSTIDANFYCTYCTLYHYLYTHEYTYMYIYIFIVRLEKKRGFDLARYAY